MACLQRKKSGVKATLFSLHFSFECSVSFSTLLLSFYYFLCLVLSLPLFPSLFFSVALLLFSLSLVTNFRSIFHLLLHFFTLSV